MSIGIIHPGAMGSSLGAALSAGGHTPHWASDGRSQATRTRAGGDGLVDVGTLRALTNTCDIIISVCPPAEAVNVAESVAALSFTGMYLDANAVSPATARTIAGRVESAGATFVDGGIIGPPARHAGLTVLYLSGEAARCDAIAARFEGSPLATHLVGAEPGAASAVKMAFAAWTKGTSALLLAVRALAEAEGVTEGLDHAWSVLTPELIDRFPATVRGTAPKAWRFAGEMREIASTFDHAGLPGGFHEAAAEIYEALSDLRDYPDATEADVIQRLTEPGP